MKVLILFATNSGATFFAASEVSSVCQEKHHDVTLKSVAEAQPEILTTFDLVFLGSNTWNYNNLEGQVHTLFTDFFQKCQGRKFPNTRFAVFGLGDASYTQLAASTDHLRQFVTDHKGVLVGSPIKIDRFYEDRKAKEALIRKWTEHVLLEFEKQTNPIAAYHA